MNKLIERTNTDVVGLEALSAEEIDHVSGGIAPLIGWGIAVTCGAGLGLLAGWVARKMC